jgi:hypothetical protein
MALHLTDRNVAHQIAERIRTLIARQDGGDVTAAARRLERSIADVYLPERVISSGDEAAAIEFLSDVARSYEVDVVWLITGATSRNQWVVTSEARLAIVEILGEMGDCLLDEARRPADAMKRGLAAAHPPPRAGAIPIA